MTIVINNQIIHADGYISIPEEKAVQFYIEKSDLDHIPPIKIDADMLSDFGKEIMHLQTKVNDIENEIKP